MADFNFPHPEFNWLHSNWLADELANHPIDTPKAIRLHQELGLPSQLPGPVGSGIRDDDEPVPVSIIIESVNESTQKRLQPAYRETKLVKNLLFLVWELQNGKEVSCSMDFSSVDPETGKLVLRKRIGILPTRGEAIIAIQKADFDEGPGEYHLNVSSLRAQAREAVGTYGGPGGLKAAGTADGAEEPALEKQPSSKAEFEKAMGNLVQILGLDELYGKEQMTAYAEKAAKNIDSALNDLGLPKSATVAITKVNLFKTIILCDDSGSMSGTRYDSTLRETVRRLVPLATRLNEEGVSLRFINYDTDTSFDGIKENQVDAKLSSVTPDGGTPLGAALERRIVGPLIQSMGSPDSLSPTLVSIITDGEAQDEDLFLETIKRCKQALVDNKLLNHRGLGHSAVIFQIHFVGTDPGALAFIDRLDNQIGPLIFCNKQQLDKHIIDGNLDPAQRNQMLLDVTVRAIDHVLDARRRAEGGQPVP